MNLYQAQRYCVRKFASETAYSHGHIVPVHVRQREGYSYMLHSGYSTFTTKILYPKTCTRPLETLPALIVM